MQHDLVGPVFTATIGTAETNPPTSEFQLSFKIGIRKPS